MSGKGVVLTRTKRSGRLAVALITMSTLLIIWTVWTSVRDKTLTNAETIQTIVVALGLILFGVPAFRAARRTRVSVTPTNVVVANGYYVNEFPFTTAQVVITNEPVDEHGDRHMFLSDGERTVAVDASLGLSAKEFDRLRDEIDQAITNGRSQLPSA